MEYTSRDTSLLSITENCLTRYQEKLNAINMNYETDASCLDRLQREALTCLNGFPNKVRALNDIIATYAPEVKTKSLDKTVCNIPGIPLTQDSVTKELNSDNIDASSIASASNVKQSVSRERITKKKHHCVKRLDLKMMRHRPGPMSHILAFLSNSLAQCAKATVIRPSRYVADRVLAMLRETLIQRGRFIHVQCGPSTIWSVPEGRASLELQIDLGATLNNCIGIMRPAAAQLIADTSKLKRWLQAVAVTFAPPTPALNYAIRKTEAIDGWAYELFFHLKYLQENRIRNGEKKAAIGFKVSDEVRGTNLWHRLVQLRDNYVFLYETLYSNNQYRNFSREITSSEMIR